MAQDNPWKKQMMNRGSANRVSNGPVQQTHAAQNPWKARTQQKNDVPAWMKKKEDSNTQPANQPPWAKQVQNTNQNAGGNQAPWMKKKQENSNQNATPPWMKKKEEVNQPSENPWKSGGVKFETPQQKKQRQQKQRLEQLMKQEQQRQRKFQEQILIKRQQEYRQARQLRMMGIQQKISIEREQQQKQRQRQRQRQRLRQKKPIQKSKKSSPNKSSKSLVKSKLSPKQIYRPSQQNYFLNFLNYLQHSTSKNDYQTRLQYQKQLLKCLKSFAKDCETKITDFLDNKKLSQKKRCYINFQDLQVKYALGQSTSVQGKSIFNIEQVQNLRNQFQFYQKLQSIVVTLMKKNSNFKIRIPLLCFINFKGIDFLCQGLYDQLLQVIPVQATSFNQIASQLIQIEKQLKDFGLQMDRNDFIAKKIHHDSYQLFIIYIKETSLKSLKNKPLSIQNFTNLQEFDRPYLNFIPDQELKLFSNTVSQNIKKVINTYRQAQFINRIYICGQGELDEQIFWKMIMQGKSQIMNMIQESGYDGIPIKNGLLLKIVECLSSVKFNFHPQVISGRKSMIKSNVPKIMHLKFQNLQIVEICSYFDKYLVDNRIQLAKEALKLRKQLFELYDQQRYSQLGLTILRNQATILLNTKQYQQAVQILSEMENNTSMFGFEKIHIYNLLISIYIIQDRENQVLQTFSKLLNILDFYFGSDTFVHSTIYSILGHYYSKIPDRSKEAQKFYQLALSIALKIYGARNPLLADVYLSRAQHFLRRQMFQDCQKDIRQAIGIYRITSKNGSRIADSLFLTSKLHLAQKNVDKSNQTFKMAQQLYLKLNQSLEALQICFILLQSSKQEEQKQKILQQICSISLKYKNTRALKKVTSQILEKELKIYPKVRSSLFTDLYDEENEQSIEQAILQIENYASSFGSYTEMVKWSINVMCLRSQSADYDKAAEIIESVLKIYKNREELEQIFVV